MFLSYERRNDLENRDKWEHWRVGNLRTLFEPVLWFQKPYKIGGTIADTVLENEIGAWNNLILANNIIETKSENIKQYHPTQKPIELIKILVNYP